MHSDSARVIRSFSTFTVSIILFLFLLILTFAYARAPTIEFNMSSLFLYQITTSVFVLSLVLSSSFLANLKTPGYFHVVSLFDRLKVFFLFVWLTIFFSPFHCLLVHPLISFAYLSDSLSMNFCSLKFFEIRWQTVLSSGRICANWIEHLVFMLIRRFHSFSVQTNLVCPLHFFERYFISASTHSFVFLLPSSGLLFTFSFRLSFLFARTAACRLHSSSFPNRFRVIHVYTSFCHLVFTHLIVTFVFVFLFLFHLHACSQSIQNTFHRLFAPFFDI